MAVFPQLSSMELCFSQDYKVYMMKTDNISRYNSHCKDKTAMIPPYHYNGNSNAGNQESFY